MEQATASSPPQLSITAAPPPTAAWHGCLRHPHSCVARSPSPPPRQRPHGSHDCSASPNTTAMDYGTTMTPQGQPWNTAVLSRAKPTDLDCSVLNPTKSNGGKAGTRGEDGVGNDSKRRGRAWRETGRHGGARRGRSSPARSAENRSSSLPRSVLLTPFRLTLKQPVKGRRND